MSGKASSSHTHDDRYYTETEVNNLLAGKASSSHTHDYAASSHTHTVAQISDLSFSLSGTTLTISRS